MVTTVERIEGGKFEAEFVGIVEKVEFEVGIEDRRQYHLFIKPEGFEVHGHTGVLHEWAPLSKQSTDEQIQGGSVMDAYLRQIEICLPAAKKAKSLKEVFQLLVGHKFRFQRIKLGREYDGNPAREYIVPVARLD